MSGRDIPHNQLAEEAVLGAILINPGAIYDVRAVIADPKDFYLVRNQYVYAAALALVEQGCEIDFVTLCGELERTNRMAEIGGPAYLAYITNHTPTAVNAGSYATEVHDWAERRRVVQAAQKIVGKCFAGAPVGEIVGDLQQAASATTAGGRSVVPISDTLMRLADKIDTWQSNPDACAGIPTGFVDFDRSLGGGLPVPGETIMFAYQKEGKTTLATQIALNAARRGFRVLFVTMEMSDESLALRVCCAATGIPSWSVRSFDELTVDQRSAINAVMAGLHDLPIHFTTGAGYTVGQIAAEIARLRAQLVVIDHVRYITDRQRGDNPGEHLNGIYREIRRAAKQNNCHVITIAHANKTGENNVEKRPTKAALQFASGDAADLIVAPYRPCLHEEGHDEHAAELLILANREGPCDTIALYYDPEHNAFHNAASDTTPLGGL